MEYIYHVRNAHASVWSAIPYPVDHAKNEYFQSPLTTVFLYPISLLPNLVIRVLWNSVLFLGIVFLFGAYLPRDLKLGTAFFLALAFSHSISDVFMAQNLIVLTLTCLVAAEKCLNSKIRFRILIGALLLAAATFLRPFSILLLPWFLYRKETRTVLFPYLAFLLVGILIPFSFFGGNLGALWWKRWILALPLYGQAADPVGHEFQSFTAAIYRWFYEFPWRNKVVETFSIFYFILAYGLAYRFSKEPKRQELCFPILLSIFYVCFPVSWIAGMLFVFPLVVKAAKNKIHPLMWVGAVIYALLPKWLWPFTLWSMLLDSGVAASAFFAIIVGAIVNLLSEITKSGNTHSIMT